MLPVNIKQVVGHPFIIPESLWVAPMLYQSEGPLMVAAQTSLTGVDTFFWFANGELTTDFGKGVYTVDAPKVQAAAGFLGQAGPVQLAQVCIDCSNPYATIVAISLDDYPLAVSGKVLIQVGTTCRPDGWSSRPARFRARESIVDGFRILDTGGKIWQVERTRARVTLKTSKLTKARSLDANLMPVGPLETKQSDGILSLELPQDNLYVLVE